MISTIFAAWSALKWAVVMLALFAGVISAFVDNVATVLMVAPVAMAISKRLNINPVPMIIAIAVSSNLQGAATLVGDTTAILLGGYANMNFLDFFFYLGKPSIFFAVELGALCAAAILLVMFRKETAPVPEPRVTQVTNYVPTILLLGTIVLLILASFLPGMPKTINGIICMSLLAIGLLCHPDGRGYRGPSGPCPPLSYSPACPPSCGDTTLDWGSQRPPAVLKWRNSS